MAKSKSNKSKSTKTTRTSAKQKLAEIKATLRDFIYEIRNPQTRNHLSITGYELKDGKKYSKSVPVPELITMVGMAYQFEKRVTVQVSGSGDDVTLDFLIVDQMPNTPLTLL